MNYETLSIAIADKVVLLDEGRVAATGTHGELLATNQRYRDVLAAMDRRRDVIDVDALAGAD